MRWRKKSPVELDGVHSGAFIRKYGNATIASHVNVSVYNYKIKRRVPAS